MDCFSPLMKYSDLQSWKCVSPPPKFSLPGFANTSPKHASPTCLQCRICTHFRKAEHTWQNGIQLEKKNTTFVMFTVETATRVSVGP